LEIMIAVWIPSTIASSRGGAGTTTPTHFQVAQKQAGVCFESTPPTRAIILTLLRHQQVLR
jgi:hypothetical protein